MKYFKHEDTSSNPKVEILIDRQGIEGYGFYFKHVEFVMANIKHDNKKEWGFLPEEYDKEYLCKKLNIGIQRYIDLLQACVKLNLIQLRDGRIFIEQVLERGDDYLGRVAKTAKRKTTKKLRSNYVVTPEKTPLEGEEEKELEIKEEKENPVPHFDYLEKIPPEDVKEFAGNFKCNELQVKSKGLALIDWCKSNGKRKKDYKAFLRNALRRDFGERPIEAARFDPDKVAPEISEQERLSVSQRIAEMRSKPIVKSF